MAKQNIIFGKTKENEKERQEWLKHYKPLVYKKVMKYPEKVAIGESIAIIQFQYNYICNFRCKHCCIAQFQMTKKEEKNFSKKAFTHDDIKTLADQCDKMGLANFVITGGEPLLFKDLEQVISAIGPERFFIAMDTNGWFLDDAKAKYLKELGIDKIQLSLDGIDEKQHDDFRRQSESWKRCIKAIDACLDNDLHIILATVVWKDRVHSQELIDYLEFAKEKGVGTYITYAKPVGAYEGRFDQMVDENDIDYVRELEKKYDVFTHLTPSYGLDMGCIAVQRMVSITRYGDVMPCPYIHVTLGNVFEEPLKDIINRGMTFKWFDPKIKQTCLCGASQEFIDEVIVPTYGHSQPLNYKKVL